MAATPPEPYGIRPKPYNGENMALFVDASGSMNVDDRLRGALLLAQEVVKKCPDVAIFAFNNVTQFVGTGADGLVALRSIIPDGGTELSKIVDYVGDYGRVIIITDGVVEQPEVELTLTLLRKKKTLSNVATVTICRANGSIAAAFAAAGRATHVSLNYGRMTLVSDSTNPDAAGPVNMGQVVELTTRRSDCIINGEPFYFDIGSIINDMSRLPAFIVGLDPQIAEQLLVRVVRAAHSAGVVKQLVHYLKLASELVTSMIPPKPVPTANPLFKQLTDLVSNHGSPHEIEALRRRFNAERARPDVRLSSLVKILTHAINSAGKIFNAGFDPSKINAALTNRGAAILEALDSADPNSLLEIPNECAGECCVCAETVLGLWFAWYPFELLRVILENNYLLTFPLNFRGLVGLAPGELPVCPDCAALLGGRSLIHGNKVIRLPGGPLAAIKAIKALGYNHSLQMAAIAAMINRDDVSTREQVAEFVRVFANGNNFARDLTGRKFAVDCKLPDALRWLLDPVNEGHLVNHGALGCDSIGKLAALLGISVDAQHLARVRTRARKIELAAVARKRVANVSGFARWMLSRLVSLSGTRVCAVAAGAVAEVVAALGSELGADENPMAIACFLVAEATADIMLQKLLESPEIDETNIEQVTISALKGCCEVVVPIVLRDLIPYPPSSNHYLRQDDGTLSVVRFDPESGLNFDEWSKIIRAQGARHCTSNSRASVQNLIRRMFAGPICVADLTRANVVKVALQTQSAVPNIAQVVAAYLLHWYLWRVETGTHCDTLALTKSVAGPDIADPRVYTVGDLDPELYATLGAPLTFAEIYGDVVDCSAVATASAAASAAATASAVASASDDPDIAGAEPLVEKSGFEL